MSTPSPLDEDLAPERLTETLRRSGGLDDGRVAEVTVETSRTTILSTVQRLRLRYEGGAGPATLIGKQPRGDIDTTLGALLHREFGFYTTVAPATPRNTFGLFDWDGWRVDTASDDLAYMMGLHWYPDRRRRYERRLLERYHATLVARGVPDYSFSALLEDYRWSALWQITTLVWQWSFRLNPAVWWGHLERAMLTLDDLDCRALLD